MGVINMPLSSRSASLLQERHDVGNVLGQADRGWLGDGGADGFGGEAVPVDGMMSGLVQDFFGHALAGREGPGRCDVAHVDEAREFVDGEDPGKLGAECLGHEGGVIGKSVGTLFGFPAAEIVLGPLRQVPVKERQPRLDAGAVQLLDQAFIKIDALFVRGPAHLGEDARP